MDVQKKENCFDNCTEMFFLFLFLFFFLLQPEVQRSAEQCSAAWRGSVRRGAARRPRPGAAVFGGWSLFAHLRLRPTDRATLAWGPPLKEPLADFPILHLRRFLTLKRFFSDFRWIHDRMARRYRQVWAWNVRCHSLCFVIFLHSIAELPLLKRLPLPNRLQILKRQPLPKQLQQTIT